MHYFSVTLRLVGWYQLNTKWYKLNKMVERNQFAQLDSRCYTTDPDKRWELCPIVSCAAGDKQNLN